MFVSYFDRYSNYTLWLINYYEVNDLLICRSFLFYSKKKRVIIINDEQLAYLIKLYQANELTWDAMTDEFNIKYPEIDWKVGRLRHFIRKGIRKGEIESRDGVRRITGDIKQAAAVTINNDGSQVSDIKIRMTAEQAKDPDYVLKAHGYEPTMWTIKKATSNIWGQKVGEEPLYQSKIVVEPKVNNLIDLNHIIERINKGIKPIKTIEYITKGNGFLAVPLFDLHFGQNTISDYQESLDKTMAIISASYKKIVVLVGGDLLHNDNHNGTTSSGTVIDKVDMTKAWDDAFDYLYAIITYSLKCAEEVEVLYVPGNHDEITGQTVIKALERLLTDNRVTFDSRQEMFKATMVGHNFIGVTHGHKASVKKYPMIYATQFSQMWGKEGVVTRELFTGHLHHEVWGDLSGLFFRQAPTRNSLDQYHRDNGFVTAQSRFQLVEYNEHEPTAVFYV